MSDFIPIKTTAAPEQSAGEEELQRTLAEIRAGLEELRAMRTAPELVRTPIQAEQITSLRLRLQNSPLLAGLFESPKSSMLGLLLALVAVAQYLQPGILGELSAALKDDGNSSAFGLAVAALSLLLGKFGKAKTGADQ